jgi:CMP-N-acetylneuraminic acid synthetase
MKIAAIVPMRHASERVKQKNYRDFAGRPLFHHIVESLLNCSKVTQIYIDTDSGVIIDDVANSFSSIIVLTRPAHLRGGTTPMNDVLEHSIGKIDADIYLQTHSTNPLLRTETIDEAIEKMLASPDHDSLFGVTRLQTRLYDANGKAMNHDPDVLLRTQDLPPVYEENSNLYLFTKNSFMQKKNRIGIRPILFEIPKNEAWDIDDQFDFNIAELLYMQRMKQS